MPIDAGAAHPMSALPGGLLINGNHRRDGLGRVVYRGCGYGHGIVPRNRGRGLVLGRNIAGNGVWGERATLADRSTAEIYVGVHWAVGNDRCNTRCRTGSQRSGRRKLSAECNHDCGRLVLRIAAGDECGEHRRRQQGRCNRGRPETRLAKGRGMIRFMAQEGILASKMRSTNRCISFPEYFSKSI